jgi:hypothetical protein
MTLSTLDIKEIKKHLKGRNKGIQVLTLPAAQAEQKEVHLSGKDLARRLKGLLTREEADTFERHINESCEQVND